MSLYVRYQPIGISSGGGGGGVPSVDGITTAVTLVAGTGITITDNSPATGSITIASIGGGTVTSVGLAAPAFLTVSGSPVTTSGTLTLSLSGTALPISSGGTNATTASSAFNNLSPMTTGGDLIYGGASGAGTRLANGTAGQILTSAGTTLAPTWASASSVFATTVDQFTGDGVTTAFTLSVTPTSENTTLVYISGVYQNKTTYNVSGTTLTFATAPPNANIIEVVSGNAPAPASPTPIGARLFLSSNMGPGGDQKISPTTVSDNTAGLWNTGTERFEITEAGQYILLYSAWSSDSTLVLQWKINGGASIYGQETPSPGLRASSGDSFELVPGDFVEVLINNGGTINAGTGNTYFSLRKT